MSEVPLRMSIVRHSWLGPGPGPGLGFGPGLGLRVRARATARFNFGHFLRTRDVRLHPWTTL